VEHRGDIIRAVLSPDPEQGLDQPDLVMFMGASANDAPAMLMEVPEEYKRTASPVMLKMFFVEDTDDVTEECPHDRERVETMGYNTVSYAVNNSTFSVETRETTTNTFMGMSFDFVSEAPVGHTIAFEIPAETQIVWVTREEMVQVLQTQDLPASAEARFEAQLRRFYCEKSYGRRADAEKKQEAQAARADIVFNRRGKGDDRRCRRHDLGFHNLCVHCHRLPCGRSVLDAGWVDVP